MASITDVAKHAGVSITTVSKVINNYSDVSEKTRKKVNESIQLLRYEPNVVARGLVKKRSWTIGILLHNIMTNPFVSELMAGMQQALSKSGYDLLLLSADFDDPDYSIVRHCSSRNVDGMVVFGVGRDHQIPLDLVKAELPTMFVDADLIGRRAGYITADNRNGILMVMEHLYELGHRKIAFVSGFMGFVAGRARFEGYQQGLKQFELPYHFDYVEICSFDSIGGYNAMQNLLKLPDRPTAVVCAADAIALGVMNAITDAGLQVPADISVVGFDNTAFASIVKPGLSTVSQNIYSIGERAVNQLIELVEKPNHIPSVVVEPVELILRESTSAPRSIT
ncbi:LacI family DNA-binding transcriptional regulator [Paenibacillus sp. MMS18-CY102]|uniref:LacI family DNA-binding transcriptional regulator n=1 Tax=Paenibacillus sp. MMS18-CY102 TaxID=2682849 RepID=UPI0013665031|nr:LacI family DNA-binding transcriptional regulator [Paenibacillus sp. MMS18-CY102]MWC28896.1 LacI family DNA-binding transcriptional regulator [Paenibacillus sp. MMS18-CY102]